VAYIMQCIKKKITKMNHKYILYFRKITETVKKDASKKVIRKNKAVQAVQEKIEAIDLTSGMLKIIFFFLYFLFLSLFVNIFKLDFTLKSYIFIKVFILPDS